MRRTSPTALIAIAAVTVLIGLVVGVMVNIASVAHDISELGRARAAGVNILLFSATAGLVAMAALETAKRLLPLRGYFHGVALRRLLGFDGFGSLMVMSQIGDRGLWWLDVPVEQLVAQVGTVATRAVDDLAGPLAPRKHGGEHPRDYYLTMLAALTGRRSSDIPVGLEDGDAGLRAEVDAALDRLHVALNGAWTRSIRLAACVASSAVAIGFVVASDLGFALGFVAIGSAFLLGGFFAWLWRDVAAGIERWRG